MGEDRLEAMFKLRRTYMDRLEALNLGATGSRPLDLSEKKSQRTVRDIALRGVEEVFEALGELKNSKSHRQTDIPDFDREKFLEEWVDAFNFFLSVLVLSGYTPDDLYDMYVRKDAVIHERITSGY